MFIYFVAFKYTIYNVQFGRLGHIWEDHIKMFLKEIGRSVN